MVFNIENEFTNDNNNNVTVDLNTANDDDDQEDGQSQVLDTTNLYVKGLWKDCSQIQLDDLFHPFGVICQSRVYGNGIGFIRYETPQQAYSAIIALNNTKPHPRCPQPLVVQFAHKKFYKPKSVLNVGAEQIEMFVRTNTKNVYIRNLPKTNFTENDFTLLCQPFGMINCIRLCNGFGFVRYFDELSAQNCIHCLHGKYASFSKYPLVAKLANADPFEPRIQFRPGSTEPSTTEQINLSPQLQPQGGVPLSLNSYNSLPIPALMNQTSAGASNFNPTLYITPISPIMNMNTMQSLQPIPMNNINPTFGDLQLMNTTSNDLYLNNTNSMNTMNNNNNNNHVLPLDYTFGQLSNSILSRSNPSPLSSASSLLPNHNNNNNNNNLPYTDTMNAAIQVKQ